MSNTTYDILKWVALVVLPALITLTSAVGTLWGWPYLAQTVGTLAASEAFLGALVGVSAESYKSRNDNGEEAVG